jgi:hypothetical protein
LTNWNKRPGGKRKSSRARAARAEKTVIIKGCVKIASFSFFFLVVLPSFFFFLASFFFLPLPPCSSFFLPYFSLSFFLFVGVFIVVGFLV